MLILKIIGLAIVAALLVIIIKEKSPEIAFLLTLATGLIILILILGQFKVIIDYIYQLAEKADLDLIYFNIIIKIIAIAYLGEFGATITKDAGQSTLSSKIELATRVIIIFLALPVIINLLEKILVLITF